MQLDLPPEIVYRESNHTVLRSLVDSRGWGFHENPAAYSAAFSRGNTVSLCSLRSVSYAGDYADVSQIFWEIRDEILEVSLGRPGENLVIRAA